MEKFKKGDRVKVVNTYSCPEQIKQAESVCGFDNGVIGGSVWIDGSSMKNDMKDNILEIAYPQTMSFPSYTVTVATGDWWHVPESMLYPADDPQPETSPEDMTIEEISAKIKELQSELFAKKAEQLPKKGDKVWVLAEV